jgi:hypothetical protein
MMTASIATLSGAANAGEHLLFGGLLSVGKNSDRYEIRGGIMSYDTGVFSPKDYNGIVFNGEFVFKSPEFLSFLGSPRPYIGTDISAVDNGKAVHFFYAGLSWDVYFTKRLYLLGSLGGSINTADNLTNPVGYKALGCNALFHLGAGIGYDLTQDLTVQLYADHFSNANLCSRNMGQEAAGIRFGYKF